MVPDDKSVAESRRWRNARGTPASDPIYGLGVVGALIYTLTQASTVGGGILGIFKAVVWPAVLVYKAFELLHA